MALSQQVNLQQQQHHPPHQQQSPLELAGRLWQNLMSGGSTSPLAPAPIVTTSPLDLSSLPASLLSIISSATSAAQQQQESPAPIGQLVHPPQQHPLFKPTRSCTESGLCAWPECNQSCVDLADFVRHINSAHSLDERSAQQCRTQIELVESLEHRISTERTRLQAMLQHLQMRV